MQVIRRNSTAIAECFARDALGRPAACLGLALALLLAPAPAPAVDVPPTGSCPPYPLSPGAGGTPEEDVVPRDFRLGEVIHLDAAERLRNYLPPEVWERRQIFFFEGMALQIGPCHRRFPAPEYFRNATAANAGKSRLDEEGNLIGYRGEGLPFAPDSIPDDAPDAGMKWAWNYRYRFQAAGFRGDFRIRHVTRRGKQVERFEGDIFLLPLHGIPDSLAAGDANGNRFAAGGRFEKPGDARGVAWRQFRSEEADRDFARSDEIFVYVPDSRRVRRSAPMSVEGMFMPSYTRGSTVSGGSFTLPDAQVSTPDPSVGVTEHWRRGFVGLLLRPNAYRFRLLRVQDVIAPINSHRLGYPADADRPYGPSGLSVANDRWDIRRAVVIEGQSKLLDQPVRRVTLYVDALTQQPLYFISRRANGLIQEVGIFVGLYSAHDPLAPKWAGNGDDFGVIVPVAQTFVVAGEGGWLRESYELRSDPPSASDWKRFTSTVKLQQRGR